MSYVCVCVAYCSESFFFFCFIGRCCFYFEACTICQRFEYILSPMAVVHIHFGSEQRGHRAHRFVMMTCERYVCASSFYLACIVDICYSWCLSCRSYMSCAVFMHIVCIHHIRVRWLCASDIMYAFDFAACTIYLNTLKSNSEGCECIHQKNLNIYSLFELFELVVFRPPNENTMMSGVDDALDVLTVIFLHSWCDAFFIAFTTVYSDDRSDQFWVFLFNLKNRNCQQSRKWKKKCVKILRQPVIVFDKLYRNGW